MEEEKLIEDCKKGVRKAQYELYKKYYPILMPICLRYHVNEVDAVSNLNAAFLKIFDKLESFNMNSSASFLAWAKRITINTLIDHYRKNKINKERIEYQDSEEMKSLFNEADFIESNLALDEETLLKFINQLPEMSKQVFCLFAIDDYAHKEISEMLNISAGTSKWHVSNARQKLMKMIQKSSASSKVF